MRGIFVPPFSDIDEILKFSKELAGTDQIVLDFSRTGFAVPSGMLLLASIISRANADGRIATTMGETPNDYPANMGFYEACGLNVPKRDAPGSATYYPITKHDVVAMREIAARSGKPVGEHVNIFVGRLAYLITRETRGDLFLTVKYCLREIIRNVAEHSESEHLLVMGQFWPQKREFSLAVLDEGIGLRRALSGNPKFASLDSDLSAIRIALLPSTSGKKIYDGREFDDKDAEGEWGNSGFGLYMTSQIARRSGTFVIGSGDSRVEIRGRKKVNGGYGLPGTLVSLTVNIDRLGRLEASLRNLSEQGEAFARRYLTAGAEVIASAASRLIMDDSE